MLHHGPIRLGLPRSHLAGLKGLLLDLDGTLVDSEILHFRSTVGVLARHGLKIRADDFARYIGWEELAIWRDLAARIGCLGDAHDLARERTAEVIRLLELHPISILPGAWELVSWAHGQGVPCAVASSLPKAQIQAILTKIGMHRMLPVCLSGHDDVASGRGKPAPDVYLAAAAALSLDARVCVAVENSWTGVRSAVSAGCFVVAVNIERPAPGDVRPDRICQSLIETASVLSQGAFS